MKKEKERTIFCRNKKTFESLVVCLSICLLFSVSVFSSLVKAQNAEDVASVEKEKEEKINEEIESLEEKAEKYRKMIEMTQSQQQTLQNQINLMQINQRNIENDISIKEKEVAEKKKQKEEIEKNIETAEKEIEKNKNILSEIVRTYNRIDQEFSLELLANRNDFSDVFSRSAYLNQVSSRIEILLKDIQRIKIDLNEKYSMLQDEEKTLDEKRKELEGKVGQLESEKRNKNVLMEKTKGDEQRYQKLLGDIQDEIYNLELGKVVDYDNIPPAKGGYFDYPVSTVRITQKYGMTSFAKSGAYGGKAHNGVDFGVNLEGIYAVADGKIIGSGNNGAYAYGKWLAIDHGDGLVTLYGHLSKPLVANGKKVKRGDKVAISGNTGFSTGPHLHFSVFDKKTFGVSESKYVDGLMIPNGASINPMRYLK